MLAETRFTLKERLS